MQHLCASRKYLFPILVLFSVLVFGVPNNALAQTAQDNTLYTPLEKTALYTYYTLSSVKKQTASLGDVVCSYISIFCPEQQTQAPNETSEPEPEAHQSTNNIDVSDIAPATDDFPSSTLVPQREPNTTERVVTQYITTTNGVTHAELEARLALLTRSYSPVNAGQIASLWEAINAIQYRSERQDESNRDAARDQVEEVTTSGTLLLPTLNNGTLSGTSTFNGPLALSAITAPSQTNSLLYNTAGSLYWSGGLIAGATVGTWTSDGTNIYRTSGNVGIGSTTPGEALSVVGNGAFTGDVTANAFYGDGSNLTGITSFSTSTTRSVFSATSPLAYDNGTGVFSVASGYTIPTTASTTAWENMDGSQWETSGSDIYFSTGNVAIGTTTAANALDVYGAINTNAANGYKIGNSQILYGSSTTGATIVGIGAASVMQTGAISNTAVGNSALASLSIGDENTAIGRSTLSSLSSGSYNTAIGYQAAEDTGGMSYGTAIGWRALNSNTTGNANTAVGAAALRLNTNGGGNTAVGYAALENTTTGGHYNTALGSSAGQANTNGRYNVAGGYEALMKNTTGWHNAVYGAEAFNNNTTVARTTAVGYRAGYGSGSNSSSNNTFLGYQTGYANTTGSNNILVGYEAGYNVTTGSNNILIGYDIDAQSATQSNQLSIGNLIFGTGLDGTGTTLSSGNIGIGTSTPSAKLTVVGDARITAGLYDNTNSAGTNGMVLQSTGSGFNWVATSTLGISGGGSSLWTESGSDIYFSTGNVAIGTTTAANALDVYGFVNTNGTTGGYKIDNDLILQASSTNLSTLVGRNAGASLISTGNYNTVVGHDALPVATYGDFNTAMGTFSMYSTTNASGNTALGYRSLYTNTSGGGNVAIGFRAMDSNTGGADNVAIGYQALFSNTSQSGNVAIGDLALYSNTGGSNTAVGYRTLMDNTSGALNTAVGYNTNTNNTTGSRNTSLGYHALLSNTTGGNNTALGYRAGYTSNGSNNIFLGHQAGDNLTTGSNNILIGYDIDAQTISDTNTLSIGNLIFGTGLDGTGTTLSSGNIGIGTSTPAAKLTVAGDAYITGGLYDSNYSTGTAGMILQSTGSGFEWVATSTLGLGGGGGSSLWTESGSDIYFSTGNVAIGTTTAANALDVYGAINTNAANGYKIGDSRVLYASSTNNSTLVGFNTGSSITSSGNYNVALGGSALASITGGDSNTAVGYEALRLTTGSANTAVGDSALRANTGGGNNVAIGKNAMYTNVTGGHNAAVGYQALYTNTGHYNTALGAFSLFRSANAFYNVSVGANALYENTTGDSNTAVGYNALRSNTSSDNNSAFGYYALYTNTGTWNSAFGVEALRSNNGGNFNIAFGSRAVYANTSGLNNMGIGHYALGSNTTGGNNTALGYRAGYTSNGSNNIFLGHQAGDNLTTGSNNILIGYDIDAQAVDSANTLSIGNLIFGTGLDGTGTTLSSGNIGIGTTTPTQALTVAGTIQSTDLLGGATNLTTDANGNIIRDPSDENLKTEIHTVENALDKILGLRGVSYEWKDKDRFGSQTELGFIAQEVEPILPEVVRKGGDYWSLNTRNILAVVVEAMKEMWGKVTEHDGKIEALETENELLKNRLKEIEAALDITSTPGETQPEENSDTNTDDDENGSGTDNAEEALEDTLEDPDGGEEEATNDTDGAAEETAPNNDTPTDDTTNPDEVDETQQGAGDETTDETTDETETTEEETPEETPAEEPEPEPEPEVEEEPEPEPESDPEPAAE